MCSAANKALDKAGVPWCVAFTCSSLSGIWTAVNAGLGITVRTSVELPKQLRKLNGLPILPKIGLGLHRTDSRLERHVERLETSLLEGPDNVWSAG
jgi:DNA-binding transcriptional LysR family regulator